MWSKIWCTGKRQHNYATVAGFRQHHGGAHGHHQVLYHGSVLGYQSRHMTHHHISNLTSHSSIPLNASKWCPIFLYIIYMLYVKYVLLILNSSNIIYIRVKPNYFLCYARCVVLNVRNFCYAVVKNFCWRAAPDVIIRSCLSLNYKNYLCRALL